MNDLIEIAKSDHKHYEFGPHHSLIIKPDDVSKTHPHQQHKKHVVEEEGHDESSPLITKRFKVHDSEEYVDQIAVESIRRDIQDHKIMSVPDMIYNSSLADEKWRNGVRMLEVSHHHLQPAVEGAEFSYYGKSETKDDKLNDEEWSNEKRKSTGKTRRTQGKTYSVQSF